MACLPLQTWLRDYDCIQSICVLLIYIQIGCALLGSLAAMFNGVLMINLVIALFALVAIESSSQSLGRTYAVLLFCAIVLDISWFILFSCMIWNFGLENYGPSFVFSVRLAFIMQTIGFSVRLFSSFLWIQMYRLGATTVSNSAYRELDFDERNDYHANLESNAIGRQNINSNDTLGGSIYDPAYYSSLFEDAQDNCFEEEELDEPDVVLCCTKEDAVLSEEILISTQKEEVQIVPNASSSSSTTCEEEQCADSDRCIELDESDFGITLFGGKQLLDFGSTSSTGSPQLKSCISRSFQPTDER